MTASASEAAAQTLPEEATAVRAAGTLVWRRSEERLEVAVVHRVKYDDWSWPKGKLEPDEPWPGAAVRETLEETGSVVRLGRPLPTASYLTSTGHGPRPKVVQYWAARPDGPAGELAHEVDAVRWVTPQAARDLLSYPRDQHQLAALEQADRDGRLDTRPVLLVRHASSVPRRRWAGDEDRRPLDDAGQLRAQALPAVLAAYGVRRLVSSDTERCCATLAPYARSSGVRLRGRHGLSEAGHQANPGRAARHLGKLLDGVEPAALCTHRPVLPALLAVLADRCADEAVAQALRESAGPGLVKGEVVVAHLSGSGSGAQVVAVERHGAT